MGVEPAVQPARVNPFEFSPPDPGNPDEMRQFANAYGYEWGYRDAKNSEGVSMIGVIPDGWAYAYVEHNRRQGHDRLTIQAAFRFWKIHGTLPGLS